MLVNYLNHIYNLDMELKNQLNRKSPFLYILTDPAILYNIGKLCAKYKIKLELGNQCLLEFIILQKLSENHDLSDTGFLKKLKAKFWMGVINIHLGLFPIAYDIFSKLEKSNHILEVRKDYKIKAKYDLMSKFNAFYLRKLKSSGLTHEGAGRSSLKGSLNFLASEFCLTTEEIERL
jgi:hypothetical protein